jgi:DNA-binding transcriptional LysR family regulator
MQFMAGVEETYGMDWDKLRIFHAAAEAGSFTHAGDGLRMSQSAVSRQVSALEKELGVALFHRHARGLVLTEQGEILFRTANEVMAKLHTAETLLSDGTTKPTGELRITAPIGLGTVWVTQRLREFMELYPEIRVEIVLNDDQLDIAMREADIAIPTSSAASSLWSRSGLSLPRSTCAASVRRAPSANSMATASCHTVAIP